MVKFMNDSSSYVNPITHMESSRTKLTDLSDQELASLCLNADPTPRERLDGWDEFFRRFVRLIHDSIKANLRENADQNGGFWMDEDIVWDIHAEIVGKLVKKGILQSCTDLAGLRPWLRTVAENQAVQWLRDNGRLRNLPKKNAEDGTLSLDEPMSDDDDNFTLADTIMNRRDVYRLERMHLEKILERLDVLKNSDKQTERRDYWIMRLSIITQLPLSGEDKSDFLLFCLLPEWEAIQKLETLIAATDKREKKREAKLGLSVVRESQLRRLESQYNELCNYDDIKAAQVAEKIKKISGWQAKLLKAGMVIPRPPNVELAVLVGLTPGQKDYVTRIIQRTREKKLTLSEEERDSNESTPECQLLEVMSL